MRNSLNYQKKHKSEDDLIFPTFRETMLSPSIRSLDEINTWIEQDYSLFFDSKLYRQEKYKLSVDKRFILDE